MKDLRKFLQTLSDHSLWNLIEHGNKRYKKDLIDVLNQTSRLKNYLI